MTPFPLDLGGMTLVIVKPAEGVSTREAYAGVRPRMPEVPLAGRLRRPVAEWQGTVTNDFEESVFAAHPAIRAAKEEPARRRGSLCLHVRLGFGRVRPFRRSGPRRPAAGADSLRLRVIAFLIS